MRAGVQAGVLTALPVIEAPLLPRKTASNRAPVAVCRRARQVVQHKSNEQPVPEPS